MKKGLILFILLTLLVSLSLTTSAAPKVIKSSWVTSADTPRVLAAKVFKTFVEDWSNGTIKVEIFPEGQLGGDRDAIEGVKLGTIQMTTASAGIYATLAPKLGVTSLPYVFKNFEEVWAFLDSDINKEIDATLTPQGLRILGYFDNGFRCMTNSKRPINTVEDVKGLKMRTPENPVLLATINALGANASPLPWPELYMALQQGAFDGQENPIPLIYTAKLYEVQKYLCIDNHVFDAMPVTINEKFWQSLTEKEQGIVQKAMDYAVLFDRNLVKQQTEQNVEALKEKGMVVTYPDLEPFVEATKSVAEDYVDVYGAELIEQIYNFSK
jgi:tripartite ATP-independent transporter DctP family solute receptor